MPGLLPVLSPARSFSVLKPSGPSLCILNKLKSWSYLFLNFLLFLNRASLFLTPLKYHFLLNIYLLMS